jgi:hypothetical protein
MSTLVLDRSGRPIPGLDACGDDMHSVFGRESGAGAELGLAMRLSAIWLRGRLRRLKGER